MFDECTDGGDDREHCFGEAIHAFFNCAKECPPPTCEDVCEGAAKKLRDECVDAGGDLDECNMAAREALAECNAKYCEKPEPPTCEDACGTIAEHADDACMEKLDDEDRCAVRHQGAQHPRCVF